MSLYSTLTRISPHMDSCILNIKESKTLSRHKLQLPAILQDCTANSTAAMAARVFGNRIMKKLKCYAPPCHPHAGSGCTERICIWYILSDVLWLWQLNCC